MGSTDSLVSPTYRSCISFKLHSEKLRIKYATFKLSSFSKAKLEEVMFFFPDVHFLVHKHVDKLSLLFLYFTFLFYLLNVICLRVPRFWTTKKSSFFSALKFMEFYTFLNILNIFRLKLKIKIGDWIQKIKWNIDKTFICLYNVYKLN